MESSASQASAANADKQVPSTESQAAAQSDSSQPTTSVSHSTSPATSQSQPSDPSSPPTSVSATATQIAEARAAVTATLSSVGAHIDSDLQGRASDIHTNSAAILGQEHELQAQTARLAKTTDRWQKELLASTKKMNEMGDLQNWAEVLERDLLVLEETVRLAEGRKDEGNISGTNRPVG